MTNDPGGISIFIDPTELVAIICVTPTFLSASILALKLILCGGMLCPAACLGIKATVLLNISKIETSTSP